LGISGEVRGREEVDSGEETTTTTLQGRLSGPSTPPQTKTAGETKACPPAPKKVYPKGCPKEREAARKSVRRRLDFDET